MQTRHLLLAVSLINLDFSKQAFLRCDEKRCIAVRAKPFDNAFY